MIKNILVCQFRQKLSEHYKQDIVKTKDNVTLIATNKR